MQRTGTRFLFALCAGLLAVTASGCGSNSGCIEMAKALCQRQIECSALLGKLDGANVEACQSQLARGCELSTKSPDTNWKQDNASQCAQAIYAASCDAIVDGPRPAACTFRRRQWRWTPTILIPLMSDFLSALPLSTYCTKSSWLNST